MKKVFNASLIAASLGLAFAANAADLTIASPTVITTEAAAAGVAAAAGAQTIRVITRSELVPGDKITLTFPIGTTFTGAASGAVNGTADFEIAYGNGTFRFANVTWSNGTATVAPTLKMDVELGNPVIANSAYDIIFKGLFTPKAGNVTYTAVDGISTVAKDTVGNNLAPLTKTSAQETATIEKKFDGFINRTSRNAFVVGKGNTVAELKISQPSNGVAGNVVATVGAAGSDLVVLKAASGLGKLASVSISTCADPAIANGANACLSPAAPATVKVDVAAANFSCSTVGGTCKDTATFDVAALTAALPAATTGKAGTWYVSATAGAAAGDTLPVTAFELTRKVTYNGVATAYTYASGDAGKFQLDATVVNVPYLPVGYAHLAPVVEVSNLGTADAEVMVEAVGKTGVKYGPVTMTAKPAKKGGVTSYFENDLLTAFGLTKGVSNEKLSVTFIINADASNISLAPYYTNSTVGSVINVVNDQYKK
ncbi:hypothetical protein [Rheinheimera metallidurans]|uniref:hypothetical protein n=1 Tax=Rheinheimera metallidurans TaxID=2925781 RepID=UPI003001B154